MLCESWIQSAIQHSCVLGTVGAQCIAIGSTWARVPQKNLNPQAIPGMLRTRLPLFFLFPLEVFSPFFNYLFVIKYRYCMLCFILGFWNMQFLTVCIWILHNFAPFVLGGEKFHLRRLKHAAWCLRRCRYINTTNPPWEPRGSENLENLQFFSFTHVTGRQGRRWKIVSDIEEKSHGILRNSMNEGNIIRIQASKNIYIRKRLPRFPRFLQGLAVQANALSEISFHRALRPYEALKAHVTDKLIDRLKKSASKTMTTSAQVME